jgi:hypothetical protein
MSSDRAARLEISIKARLLDARRHLQALEYSAAGFGGDFDLPSFEQAWRSNDPNELNRSSAALLTPGLPRRSFPGPKRAGAFEPR